MLNLTTIIVLVAILAAASSASNIHASGVNNSFLISPDGTTFLRNGQPHRILSAGFHYFRCPADEWEERLLAIQATGSINTIQTYIAWNFHCPDAENECSFDGDKDLIRFLQLCQKHGFDVLLRPGPYICAEWEFGGFPAWIVAANQSIKLRTSDPQYLAYVTSWYNIVLPLVKPYMLVNGGPVLMVQVENEYGSYSLVPDTAYLTYLRDLTASLVGKNVLLYSTDPNGSIDRSSIAGVYQAIDFLYWGQTNTNASWWWEQQAAAQVNSMAGPPMNDEFYPGWLSQWNDPWVYSHTVSYVDMMVSDMMISSSSNSNMNFYMFFGGTNFGFWNGGVVTTSYDYGAPVNESGHPTDKYFSLVQNVFPLITGLNSPPAVPIPNTPLPTYYGTIDFDESNIRLLQDPNTYSYIVGNEVTATAPVTMEALGQSYGYISYTFDVVYPENANTSLTAITVLAQDYALIYLDDQYIGHLQTIDGLGNLTISPPEAAAIALPTRLTIVVENTGRPNTFLSIQEIWKGIRYPVIFTFAGGQSTQSALVQVSGLPMNYANVSQLMGSPLHKRPINGIQGDETQTAGYFARGTINIPNVTGGTLLDMRAFGKGFVFVNGKNVGRFYSVAGPQYSLWIPRSYLANGINEIIVFEQTQVFSRQSGPVVPSITLSDINYNIKKDTLK